MRRVLSLIFAFVLAGSLGCQRESHVSEPPISPTSDSEAQVAAPGEIAEPSGISSPGSPSAGGDPCDCDPFDSSEAEILEWRCTDLVATGRTCIEINVSPMGVSFPKGIPMCCYTKQKKSEYRQMCQITYRCNGETQRCTFGPFPNCVWQSDLVEKTVAVCGQNPYAGQDTCTPLPPCQ
jgi:hypothetical protein